MAPRKLRLRGFPVVSVSFEPKDWLYILARVLAAPPDAADCGALLLHVSRVLLDAGRPAPGEYDVIATKLRQQVDALAIERGAFEEPDAEALAGQIRVHTAEDARDAFRRRGVLLQGVQPATGALDLKCVRCGTRWGCGPEAHPPPFDCPQCGPQPESEP